VIDVQELVEETIAKHRFERHSVSETGYFAWWGHCTGCGFEGDRRNSNYVGWELDMRDEEARHIARIVAANLT
jgi:hypothetical protein